MSNVRRKVDLYMVSIGLLFAFLIVMTVKLPAKLFLISDFAFLSIPLGNLIL